MLYFIGMDFSFDLPTLLATLVSLIIGLSIHEAMHAYASLKLGDTTAQDAGRLSLNPLDHIDPITTVLLPIVTLLLFHAPILAAKPVPFNPYRVRFGEYGAAIIAAAGPLTNLVLAIIGGVIAHAFTANIGIYNALTVFVSINIGLFVFNSIPIPPLDGSRVLFAFAPESVQRVMAQIERYGIFVVFALVIFITPFRDLIINLNVSLSQHLL
jgi:Zn-dependent protease